MSCKGKIKWSMYDQSKPDLIPRRVNQSALYVNENGRRERSPGPPHDIELCLYVISFRIYIGVSSRGIGKIDMSK